MCTHTHTPSHQGLNVSHLNCKEMRRSFEAQYMVTEGRDVDIFICKHIYL